ncbi:hypothetical protein HYT18_02095 [Candidatus Microgenomates bacterium]|nr:hypothetical protein [Candidatus Microgenomates bacterium]
MNLVEQKLQWIPIIEMVPKDSIGFTLISEISGLGGRLRPKTTFSKLLETLWPANKALLSELQGRNITIVYEILSLPDDQLSSFANKFRVRERLKEYLEGQRLTPHARVLEAAFGEQQYPVPPESEGEIVGAVGEKVATLPEREQRVLRLRLGLDDGIRRTLKEIGSPEHMGRKIGREGIRVIEAKALWHLRSRSHWEDLTGYLSLPEENLGREFLGAVFMKDLPKFPYLSVRNLDLSDTTKEEVANISIHSLDDLVKVNLQDVTLSQKARGELGNELKKMADKYYRQQEEEERRRKKEEQQKGLERQRLLDEWESRPKLNNLISEIILSPEHMELLGSIRLSELGLSTRVYNSIQRELNQKIPFLIKGLLPEETTLVELLNFSIKDLADIRGIGVKGVVKLGEKLGYKLEQLLEQEGIKSQVNLLFERQIARQTVEVKFKSEVLLIRNRIKEAAGLGFTTPKQIHEWLIRTHRDKRISDVRINSWVIGAMIEYVLSHPEIEAYPI